jgi:hypothetical protein
MDVSSLTSRSRSDQLVVGPQVAGRRIYRHDAQRCIIIDGRLFRLSPSEYRVSLPLLCQRERWERGQAPPWTSCVALIAESGIPDATLLHRHIAHASNKLTPAGIEFVRIRNPAHGDLYQTLVQERDVQPRKGDRT